MKRDQTGRSYRHELKFYINAGDYKLLSSRLRSAWTGIKTRTRTAIILSGASISMIWTTLRSAKSSTAWTRAINTASAFIIFVTM